MGLFERAGPPAINGVLTNTHVLLLVAPNKTPHITCGRTESENDYRLSVEVLGHGHGCSVHLRGPLSVLHGIVSEMGVQLDRQHELPE